MPVKKQPDAPEATPQNFPVVGVGASAGGLEAFKKLLGAIPEKSGMAFVLIQHLDPKHDSFLPEILSRVTKLPVHEITDDIHLAPDHIYTIPSNKNVTAFDGVLKLSAREQHSKRNMPIDRFFTSLAEVHQSFAVGVVLAGNANDGTQGLRAIKSMGGITFAQSAESTPHPDMPLHAIQAEVVDFVLPPEKMPAQLQQVNIAFQKSFQSNGPDSIKDEEVFRQIIIQLRQKSGVDFTYYKQTTIRRRLARRMAINKCSKMIDYLHFLQKNRSEQEALFQDMLIPVTAFYRDARVFSTLKDQLFPQLIESKASTESVRLWVAGCSTGEEAYSLAICLHELLADQSKTLQIQIFASDISEASILKARAGIYSKHDIESVSEARLQQYFIKTEGGYQLSKQIRDMCLFAVHNFLSDPPFARMDFISCRNVLIYMDPFLQKKAFNNFHYALKPKGYLLLGKSETTGNLSELFAPFAKNERIYSSKPRPGRTVKLPEADGAGGIEDWSLKSRREKKFTGGTQTDFQKAAEEVLLAKYTPAGVIINEQMDIVHFRGTTGQFLEPSPGKPSLNLMKMAREGLGFEIRNAIHKAKSSSEPVRKEGIPLKGADGKTSLIAIEVVPLVNTLDLHFLVLFTEMPQTPEQPAAKLSALQKKPYDALQKGISRLEKELSQSREDMRSITEDQEAANEELQSANEELLSSSEELQSLNEELETSKEELQSTNEELMIVNQEMTDHQNQLNAARLYAEAIVSTIREPLIVMDQQLKVKSANQSFYTKFQVSEEETEGKLLYDLGSRQWDNPVLRTLLQHVLTGKTNMENFEMQKVFPNIGERYVKLNARRVINEKNSIQLILLAIQDVTELKAATRVIEQHNAMLKNLYINAPASICIFEGPEHRFVMVNPAYQQLFLHRRLLGLKLQEALPELIGSRVVQTLDEVYNTGNVYTGNEEPMLLLGEKDSKTISRYFNFTYQPVQGDQGRIDGVLVFAYEVTSQVISRQKEAESTARFKFLADAMPQKVWCADATGKLNYFNKKWLDFSHLTETELIQAGWEKLVHPEDWLETSAAWQHSIETGEDFEMEHRLPDHSGVYSWHLSRGIAHYEQDGRITMWVGTNTNIHDQKLFRDELEILVNERTFSLRKTNIELEHSIKNLEQFASIASHDLQEPLRKVQTFATLLMQRYEKDLPLPAIDLLKKIFGASGRMSVLIKDVLNFSKVLQEKDAFVSTDLNMILQNVLEDFELLINEKQASIRFAKLPVIEALPLQINQLFNNLLSNSLKFARKDTLPEVRITYMDLPEEEVNNRKNLNHQLRYFEITFRDNGIGFEQQFEEQIFLIFERLNHHHEYSGTGIGLALCQKIVNNHQGSIHAESRENEGAVFYVVLPYEQTSRKILKT